MRPALHKSTSIKKPATTKYMKTSNTMKKSITNIHEDYFNVEEMMTKNKIRKFREIGVEDNANNTGIKRGDTRTATNREHINLYDELVENVVNYNVEKSPFILFPDNKMKVVWDLIGMVFIIYQGILVPFRICFEAQAYGILGVFELIQDFYFLFDIILTANTGYYHKGNLILMRKLIFLNYLKLWFWLDLAASFPYSMLVNLEEYFNLDEDFNTSISTKAPQILRILKFMRFMRFLRLIRVLKLKKILVRFEEFFLSDSFNLIIQFSKLLFIVLFIAHWGACFWFFIGISEFNEKGKSWISENELLDASTSDQYISSIYYYITTMTTVGYGDITPITTNEKLYAMFSMLIACGVFAYVIGSIGTVLSSKYDEEMIFKQKIMYVDQFLRNKNLTKNVRTKVRRYLEHVLENRREQKVDESEILTLLNKNLKEEVIMHLNGLLLKNKTFSVISKYDEFCILLTNVMRQETLNPNDMIFQKGDHSLRLYFVNNGIVTMFDQETKIVYRELSNISHQNCFGEIGFFAGQKRCCSAESLTFSNLTYILIDLFKEMAYKFQQLHKDKFKNLEEDLINLRAEIRGKNYSELNLKCYLCEADSHIAPDCQKLKNISDYFFFKFKDRRHKSEQEIKRIYDWVTQNSGSCHEDRRKTNISFPSFTKNTNDVFFSFAEVDQQNSIGVDKSLMKSNSKKSESENNQSFSDRSIVPSSDEKKNLDKSKISEKSESNKSSRSSKLSKSSHSPKLFYMRNNISDKSTSPKIEANLNTIENTNDGGVNKGVLVLKDNITNFKKLTSKEYLIEDV